MKSGSLLVSIALLLTGCGGGADEPVSAPTAAAVSDPASTSERPMQEASEPGFLTHLDADQLETLDQCGDGQFDACEVALDFLTDDDFAKLSAFCDAGDDLACNTLTGLEDARDVDCGDFCGSDMPEHGECEDECTDDNADAFIQLNAEGINTDAGYLDFGSDPEVAVELLTSYWGPASNDTGWISSAGNCNVGDLFRTVEWDWKSVVFIDGAPAHDGAPHLASWVTTDPDQSVVAFVGDATLVSILPGHTTAGQLRDELGESVSIEDAEPFGPSFFVEDNWGSMRGELTGLGDDDIVQSVTAGDGCAE